MESETLLDASRKHMESFHERSSKRMEIASVGKRFCWSGAARVDEEGFDGGFSMFLTGVPARPWSVLKPGTTCRLGLLRPRVSASALLLLAAVFGVCVVGPSSALGARAHAFARQFGESGTGSGQLALAEGGINAPGSGVAASAASHDLYVADTGNRRVDEFTSSGSFVRAWGWGVSNGASELQVCTTTCLAGLAGSAAGQFETPSYVAVDNDPASESFGDVYVIDIADRLVTKFNGEGGLQVTWGNNGENASHERVLPNGQMHGFEGVRLDGVAVDGSGDLWVFNDFGGLFELTAAGSSLLTHKVTLTAGAGSGGIAVSGACSSEPSCEIYVLDAAGRAQRVVFEHGTSTFSAPKAVTTADVIPTVGIGADPANGDLYTSQSGKWVEDFAPDCAVGSHGCAPSQTFGELESTFGGLVSASGISVSPDSGTVFAADGGLEQIVAFALVLEASTASAEAVKAHSATLAGTLNPMGEELTRCSFEYGETMSYGSSVECAESNASIGTGTSPVPVNAAIHRLQAGTTYHFRLRASNGHANIYGADETLTTLPAEHVLSLSATDTETSAVLEALVNPEGLPAHYHFEYGECSASSCQASPYTTRAPATGDAPVAAGTTPVTVSQPVSGLLPGTTYHFKLVIEDANDASEALPPQLEGTFVFSPPRPSCESEPRQLPDCRAYEMVTPPDKNGALIDNGLAMPPPQVSADGSRVIATSIQCFHAPPSCVGIRRTEGEPYRFTRDESGWVTEPLATPSGVTSSTLNYDAETGYLLIAPPPTAPEVEQFYARQPDGTSARIGPLAEPSVEGFSINQVAAATLDTTGNLSHLIYQVSKLWPSFETGVLDNEEVYEYVGTENSAVTPVGVTSGSDLISACGTFIGASKDLHNNFNTLSADGRTVFFTATACPSGTGANTGVPVPSDELWERVEGPSGRHSVLVSAPSVSECDSSCRGSKPGDASFQGASTDGSRVFFTSTQRLTTSATEDAHQGDSAYGPGCMNTSSVTSGCNLYEFVCPAPCGSTSEGHLIDLSAGDSSGLGPRVQSVLALPTESGDAYFIARGVLTTAPNQYGALAQPGSENLYAYKAEGAAGHVVYVATLATADSFQWRKEEGIGVANVSPDGGFLVFTSHRSLTPDALGREGAAQVYRYDLAAQTLSRVSIGQRGFDNNGNSAVANARLAPAGYGFTTGAGVPRPDPTMSHDGRFVFFESPTGLTPDAANDRHLVGNPNEVFAENVYEWEAPGTHVGGASPCVDASGCVSLISDGKDLHEGSSAHENLSAVQLLGTDATGDNVFFWTADQLVKADSDTQVDLYDARTHGGFVEPQPKAPCEGLEECRPPVPPVPVFESLPSNVLTGRGNAPDGFEEGAPSAHALPTAPHPRVTSLQRLRKELRACAKKHSRHARRVCEARARKRYAHARRNAGKSIGGR